MRWSSERQRQWQAFLENVSVALAYDNDVDILVRRLSRLVGQTFAVRKVLFVMCRDGAVKLHGGRQEKILSPLDARAAVEWIRQQRAFHELVGVQAIDAPLRQALERRGISVILPLAIKDELVGLMLLGESAHRRRTRKDDKLLRIVSGGIAVAIHNAHAMREIRELNDELKQRVTCATSELARSNRQLQKLDSAKNDFISMASHQLRTPLTSIKGYLDMLLEGDFGPLTDAQRQVVSEAFSSSERMVQLINDFLSVSRLQTGKFIINLQPTRLDRLVKEEVMLLAVVATQRNIQLKTHVARGIPPIQADGEKLRQVIMNMIDNAIYYSRPDSTVHISLKIEQSAIVFLVEDTGIGVPKAEQAELFGKFFRATNARQRRPDGTGVGLFLARKVIAEHDGEIIFSSIEGKGSTFGFRLPLAGW